MLCYNDGKTARRSVESLIPVCKDWDSEIVVVDNMSEDGSFEVLEGFGPPVRVLRKRCTRGAGRNLALQAARGRYVIAQLDCDDIFSYRGLDSLLRIYHSRYEGEIMMTKRGDEEWYAQEPITIGPKDLLLKVGGWRDVNWYEDWDLWARAAGAGVYSFLRYPENNPPHAYLELRWDRRLRFVLRAKTTFQQYADSVRIGRAIIRRGERIEPSFRGIGRGAVLLLATFYVRIRRKRLSPVPDQRFYEYSAES